MRWLRQRPLWTQQEIDERDSCFIGSRVQTGCSIAEELLELVDHDQQVDHSSRPDCWKMSIRPSLLICNVTVTTSSSASPSDWKRLNRTPSFARASDIARRGLVPGRNWRFARRYRP